MNVGACVRTALLLSVAGLGMALSPSPTVLAPGFSTAEARTARRSSGSRRVTRSRRVRAAVVAAAIPLPPVDSGITAALRSGSQTSDEIEIDAPLRLERLGDALRERARTLAAQDPAPLPSQPAARSVLFDFETGLKTTVFEGGASVREPFDMSAARILVAPRPPARAGVPSS